MTVKLDALALFCDFGQYSIRLIMTDSKGEVIGVERSARNLEGHHHLQFSILVPQSFFLAL